MNNLLIFSLIVLMAVAIIFAIIANKTDGVIIPVVPQPPSNNQNSNNPNSTYWDYAQTLCDALNATTQYTKVIPPSGIWQLHAVRWQSNLGMHYKAYLSSEINRYNIRTTETILQEELYHWTAFYGLCPVEVTLSLCSAKVLIITLSPAGQFQPMVRQNEVQI